MGPLREGEGVERPLANHDRPVPAHGTRRQEYAGPAGLHLATPISLASVDVPALHPRDRPGAVRLQCRQWEHDGRTRGTPPDRSVRILKALRRPVPGMKTYSGIVHRSPLDATAHDVVGSRECPGVRQGQRLAILGLPRPRRGFWFGDRLHRPWAGRPRHCPAHPGAAIGRAGGPEVGQEAG